MLAAAAFALGVTTTAGCWLPCCDAGVGGVMPTPIQSGPYSLAAKQSTTVGALFGGGLAYEISPSFDIRAEYRALLMKTPGFVTTNIFNTNRYEVVSMPAIGVAYHF